MRRQLAREGVEAMHFPWPVEEVGRGFARGPAHELLFLYVGRLNAEKGVADLVTAFARVRERISSARLRVVGEGPELSRLRSLADRLGLRRAVEFVGRVPHERVEHELERPWALVAPSRWAEPLGQSAIEALVRGVPVVASERGGLPESVGSGAGLLYPNGDADALADRLLELAELRRFPDHAVPEETVRELRDRHSTAAHVARIREVFASVARGG
jgi:glycosyltransferase involved in cell wall biosynthesis